MGKLLDFFAKVTFSGYVLREHKVTKNIVGTAYSSVIEEQKKLADLGTKLPLAVKEVSDGIAADKTEISRRPTVRSRAEFFDDTGLSSAQLRAKQLEVLKKVNAYNSLIDKEAEKISTLNDIKNGWEARLAAKVVVQAKKVSPKVVDEICKGLYDVNANDLSDALKNGGALKKLFSYNEAVIAVDRLSGYKISAKVVECNAEEQVQSMAKGRDSESDLRRVARNQRIFISVVFLLFWGIMAAIYLALGNDAGIAFAVVAGVGAAVIFLVLWLLFKPILAVAWRAVNRSFKKNAEKIIDRTGYLRGVVLSEEYEKGLDVLYTGLIDCLNAYNVNRNTVTQYAAVFLPERVYAGLLPMVIEQMSIGAAFNDALFKTEATIDRRAALQREEERNAWLEKEKLRHNAEMETQARRRADAERQRARAIEHAVEEQKRYNSEIRAHTRAVEENTREIRKLRND